MIKKTLEPKPCRCGAAVAVVEAVVNDTAMFRIVCLDCGAHMERISYGISMQADEKNRQDLIKSWNRHVKESA